MRGDILKRLNELSDVGTRRYGIQRRGNLYFYNRRASNENDFRIYVREGLGGAVCASLESVNAKNSK